MLCTKKKNRQGNTTTIATWNLNGRLTEQTRQEELFTDMKWKNVDIAAQWRGEPRALEKIITGAEVTEAAKRLRNNRALGPDDVAGATFTVIITNGLILTGYLSVWGGLLSLATYPARQRFLQFLIYPTVIISSTTYNNDSFINNHIINYSYGSCVLASFIIIGTRFSKISHKGFQFVH